MVDFLTNENAAKFEFSIQAIGLIFCICLQGWKLFSGYHRGRAYQNTIAIAIYCNMYIAIFYFEKLS